MHAPLNAPARGLFERLLAVPLTLLRLALALIGVVAMFAIVLFGMAVAGGLLMWAVLRGRRRAGRSPAGAQPRSSRRAAAIGEVIDIEARELPSGPARSQPEPISPRAGPR